MAHGSSIRITHISDLHIEPRPERMYPGVGEVLEQAAALVRRERPDFVLVTGDLTSHGSVDPSALTSAREWLDSLGTPLLVVAGNHDLGANAWRGLRFPLTEGHDPRPLEQTHYGRIFGAAGLVTHDLGPVLLIGMNLRAGDPDHVLLELDETLQAADRPVILCGHYPLATTRTEGPLETFGAGDFIPDLVPRLTDLIAGHRVILYAAGHVHAVTARKLTPGCLQLTAGALGPGPSAFRQYTLWPDRRLTYTTVLGPGPLGFWERIEPQYSPYPPEYHLGRPEERDGIVNW